MFVKKYKLIKYKKKRQTNRKLNKPTCEMLGRENFRKPRRRSNAIDIPIR